MMRSVSIVFPCYNDRQTIETLVCTTNDILTSRGLEHEIIVVDDGSSDGSRELLQSLSERVPVFRCILHEDNKGYGATIRTGLNAARYPLVFYTDGDGQYDPKDLPILLERMEEGVQIVTGYRRPRKDPIVRVLASRLFYGIVQRVTGLHFRDVSCDCRLMRKEILPALDLRAEGGELGLEILLKSRSLGLRIVECPVSHFPRPHGTSLYFRPSVLLRTLKGVARLVLRRSGDTR